MEKRLLLGIDASFSFATQYAIRTVGDLFPSTTQSITVLLLHAIPSTHIVTEYPGYFTEQYMLIPPSSEQKKHAEEILAKASTTLQKLGFEEKDIEQVICVGSPAEEIVKAAHEHRANLIVVGSRGDSWRQRLRRILLGSISRQVLHAATCPVMVVLPPRSLTNQDIVLWYEQALQQYLKEHHSSLTVLKPQAVTALFPLPHPGPDTPRQLSAATSALEKLARKGVLCRRDIQGEVHYIND
ncbi:universal stress protein [Dictyobacter arantiisoli]|uniref:UspA domain-containing protein n=1 Tax=Dictyobacter arantiisoli TaxID=2014874 RepID=A0A5A5TJM0_9CHLR|nr:universal stress protein [Dictyobacter arantiisoli]GCF11445.1 hypothetical protein KDI_50090 [Dictyobacter arantiisoli]